MSFITFSAVEAAGAVFIYTRFFPNLHLIVIQLLYL